MMNSHVIRKQMTRSWKSLWYKFPGCSFWLSSNDHCLPIAFVPPALTPVRLAVPSLGTRVFAPRTRSRLGLRLRSQRHRRFPQIPRGLHPHPKLQKSRVRAVRDGKGKPIRNMSATAAQCHSQSQAIGLKMRRLRSMRFVLVLERTPLPPHQPSGTPHRPQSSLKSPMH